jgi:hypothetical protein
LALIGETIAFLSVSQKLQEGHYLFVVVRSNGGWIGLFAFQHFIE